MAEAVTRTLASYAFGLIKFQPLKFFVMMEDDDGNRYWAANGKLRSEFFHDRKLDNRNWGMFELEDIDPTNPPDVNATSDLPTATRDRDRDRSDRDRGRSARNRDRRRSSRDRPESPRHRTRSPSRRDRDRSPRRKKGEAKRSLDRSPRQLDAEDHPNGNSIHDSAAGVFDDPHGLQAGVDVCPRCGLLGHDIPDCPLIQNEGPPSSYGNGPNSGDAFFDVYEGGSGGHGAFMGAYGNNGGGLLPLPPLMGASAVPTGMMNTNAEFGPSLRCSNCSGPGHFADECPLLSDFRFQSQPDEAGEAPLDRDFRPDIECFNCGNIGHHVSNCPMPKDEESMARIRGRFRDTMRERDARRERAKGSKRRRSSKSNEAPSRPPRRRSKSPDGIDELRPLLKKLEERGILKYKWLANAKKYLLILPNENGKSDTLVNVENLQELSEASEKYGFLNDVDGVSDGVSDGDTSIEKTTASEKAADAEPPLKDPLLAQSLALLEEKGLLRYKWLENSQKYLLFIPKGSSSSDWLVNVGTVGELIYTAKQHGFAHGISSLTVGDFDGSGEATTATATATTTSSTSATTSAASKQVTDPASDLLAGTLADLESSGVLRYKWLPNGQKYLIIIPQIGKSDILVNVSNMPELIDASRIHGFNVAASVE